MPLQQYGIFAPVMGIREDMPNILLEEVYTPNSDNVHMRQGEIHSAKMRNETLRDRTYVSISDYTKGDRVYYGSSVWVSKTDGNTGNTPAEGANWTTTGSEILAYHRFLSTANISYIFAFTAQYVYEWAGSPAYWVNRLPVLTAPAPVLAATTAWSITTFVKPSDGSNQVIATNGIDAPIAGINGAAWGWLEALAGIVTSDGAMKKIQHFAVFENYLIAGNVEIAGVSKPSMMYWSDISDPETWNSDDAGSLVIEGDDPITGFGQFRDFLMIFKERAIHRLWLSTDDLIFGKSAFSRELGCKSPRSIINAKDGSLFFFAADKTIREIQHGEVSQAYDKTIKDIEEDNLVLITSQMIDLYDEIWFSVPIGAGVTANNKILTFNAPKNIWGNRSYGVSAFGRFRQDTDPAVTWDTIDAVKYGTWDSWDPEGGWGSIEHTVGYIQDLGSGAGGASYELHGSSVDIGSAFTASFELSTDLSQRQRPGFQKRVSAILIFVKYRTGGNLTINLKRDNESTFQSVGTVDLSSVPRKEIHMTRIPVDFIAKHFLLQGTSTNSFQFVGVIFEYVLLGRR